MRLTRRNFILTPTWLLLPALGALPEHARAGDGLVVVPVVGAQSRLRDISPAMLRRVFLGAPVDDPWGRRFVPFNQLAKSRERVLFDERMLGMSPDQVARHWVDERIRGNGRPPRSVAGVVLLKQVVAQFPGAISYLKASDLDASVRALTVGGVPHSAADYPIR